MARSSKPRLTRRLQRQYQAILQNNQQTLLSYCWPMSDVMHAMHWPHQRVCAWAAANFAKDWKSRDIDVKKLQGMVLRGGDPAAMLRFARDVPGANVRRLQAAVEATFDRGCIQAFRQIEGADVGRLERLLVVLDVMEH